MQSKKLFLLFFSCLILLTQVSKAQLNVLFKDNTAFLSVKVDTGKVNKGKIDIDKLPDSIVLHFPDEDFQNFSMMFNKDSLKFFVGFGCSGDSCVKLLLSDLKGGKAVLKFFKNNLIGVNNRRIEPREVLVKDKKGNTVFFIGIVQPQKKEEKTEEKAKDTNPLVLNSTESKENPQQIADLNHTLFDTLKMDCACNMNCGKQKDINGCCVEKIPSDFNQLFLKPCEGGMFRSWDKAVTPKYRIVIDERKGALTPVTYLKLKNKKDYQYYRVKNWIHPVAGNEIALTVIGHKDSTYIIDSSARQNFMEYEKDFAAAFKNIPADTPSSTTNSDEQAKKGDEENSATESLSKTDSLQELLNAYSLAITLKAKMDTLQTYKVDFITPDFTKFVLVKGKPIQKNIEGLLDEYINAHQRFFDMKQSKGNTEKQIKTLIEKINRLEEQIKKEPSSTDLKAQLKFIEMTLLNANHCLASRKATMAMREDFLYCFKLFVNKKLYIAVPDNPEEFKKLLQNLASNKVAKIYYTDFDNLITQIESEYKKLVFDKSNYGFFTKQVQAPNADEIDYAVKTTAGREIFKRSFRTSIGFKLDFSTGLFVSGLANSDFLLVSENFRFKETMDTVNTTTGNIDTIYTGRIIDTTGKFIRENKKLSYNVGFIIHAYTRTGTFVNVGIAAGTIFNESQIQFLLGGSLMFNVGKQRLAFTGGCTFGRQKTLNSDIGGYLVEGTVNNENKMYNSRHMLPKFYTGDSNINTSTYMKSATSWFFGITYNFASLNMGK